MFFAKAELLTRFGRTATKTFEGGEKSIKKGRLEKISRFGEKVSKGKKTNFKKRGERGMEITIEKSGWKTFIGDGLMEAARKVLSDCPYIKGKKVILHCEANTEYSRIKDGNFHIFFGTSIGCVEESELPEKVWGVDIKTYHPHPRIVECGKRKGARGLSNLGIPIVTEERWPIAELVDQNHLYIRIDLTLHNRGDNIDADYVFRKILKEVVEVLNSGKPIRNERIFTLLKDVRILSCWKKCTVTDPSAGDVCRRLAYKEVRSPARYVTGVTPELLFLTREREWINNEWFSFQVMNGEGQVMTNEKGKAIVLSLAQEEKRAVEDGGNIPDTFMCLERQRWLLEHSKYGVTIGTTIETETEGTILVRNGSVIAILDKDDNLIRRPISERKPETRRVPFPEEINKKDHKYYYGGKNYLHKLLMLKNCYIVDNLPNEKGYVNTFDDPNRFHQVVRRSKSVYVTKEGAAMVCIEYNVNWHAPVSEVYLKKSAWPSIKAYAEDIYEKYWEKPSTKQNFFDR